MQDLPDASLNPSDELYRWRRQWVQEKIDIARRLASGDCGAGYPEATMVLCGVLSALAAERWPGRRKDKERFIELLVRYTPPGLHATRISIPLLVGHLRERQQCEAESLRRAQWKGMMLTLKSAFLPMGESQVIYGSEVDQDEAHVLQLCPDLERSILQKFSYATLLYEEIRCGYAHEYTSGPQSGDRPMGRRPDESVSYINHINDDWHDRSVPPTISRLIYFNLRWMAALTESAERFTRGVSEDRDFSDWWFSKSRSR